MSSSALLRFRRSVGLIVAMVALVAGLITASPASAAYPGANGRIAFARANQIYTIKQDGSGLKQLTSGAKNYWPRWSPNGKRIAYINETSNGLRDIWVMNADGSNKKRVTNLGYVQPPSWSPDGKQLAFGGGGTSKLGGYLMVVKSTAPFGTPVELLGRTPGDEEPPTNWWLRGATAWSPNGQDIFFYTDSYPSSPDHYIVTYNIPTQIFKSWIERGGACCGPEMPHQPALSANGLIVGYTETTDSVPVLILTQVSSSSAGLPFITQPQDEQIAFAPNGKKVAFMNDANGTARIFIANPNGSGRKVLANGYQPDWQPLP